MIGQKREEIRQWVNEIYKPMSSYLLQNKLDNEGKRIEEIISAENGVTNNIRYAKNRIVSTSRGVFP